MGISVKAVIAITTAGAVLGLARLARGASDVSDKVDEAGSSTDGLMAKLNRFSKVGKKVKALAFGSMMQRANTIHEAFQPPPKATRPPVAQRVMTTAEGLQKAGLKAQPAVKAALEAERVQAREAELEAKAALRTQRSISQVMKALQEGRAWWKLFHREAAKPVKTGIQPAVAQVKQLNSAVKQVRGNITNLYGNMSGMLNVVGGGGSGVLGGAGSMVERAMGLSSSREAAMITFDTLMGDRDKSAALVAKVSSMAAATPFQEDDLVAGSKRLLRVTTDVEKNMDLLKMAANIAALTPGSSVEDVSRGITQAATSGEFEILKGTYGIAMNAKMFDKSAGEAGYQEDVIAKIQELMMKQTGGRDLVAALSQSMIGKFSTFKDGIDTVLLNIGQQIGAKMNLGGILDSGIEKLSMLGQIVTKLFTSGTVSEYPPALVAVGRFIVHLVDGAVWLKDKVLSTATAVYDWFNSLGPGMQDGILASLFGAASLGTILAVITPVLAFMSVIGPMVMAAGSAFMAVGSSVATFVGSLGLLGFTMTEQIGMLAVATAYDPNQGFIGSVVSAFGFMWNFVSRIFSFLIDSAQWFWKGFEPMIGPGLSKLGDELVGLRAVVWPIVAALFSFGETSGWSADVAMQLGEAVGWFVSQAIDGFVWLAWGAKLIIGVFSDWAVAIISDIQLVLAAIVTLVTGAEGKAAALKTIFLGIADAVSMPIRILIQSIFVELQGFFEELEAYARPYNDYLADKFKSAAHGYQLAAEREVSGFLETRKAALDAAKPNATVTMAEGTTPVAHVSVKTYLDGEKVAENSAKTQMKSRASGRGGDPLTPEEIGFAMSDGRIVPVGFDAVAASL